jgi:hypothetical protein
MQKYTKENMDKVSDDSFCLNESQALVAALLEFTQKDVI